MSLRASSKKAEADWSPKVILRSLKTTMASSRFLLAFSTEAQHHMSLRLLVAAEEKIDLYARLKSNNTMCFPNRKDWKMPLRPPIKFPPHGMWLLRLPEEWKDEEFVTTRSFWDFEEDLH
jgi:hypothetical protein